MKNYSKFFFLLGSLFVFCSCSHRLVGTWNVDKYEVTNQGSQGVVLQNVGTITMEKNGKAVKNLDLNFFTTASSNEIPLQWITADEKTVTISGDDSEFAKTWIVITDKRKKQVWKATDGSNRVQTLELSKK